VFQTKYFKLSNCKNWKFTFQIGFANSNNKTENQEIEKESEQKKKGTSPIGPRPG
jgi:hypothetical protein